MASPSDTDFIDVETDGPGPISAEANERTPEQEAIARIVREEMAAMVLKSAEEQEAELPALLAKVEERATAEYYLADDADAGDLAVGADDRSLAVVEGARGEIKRLLAAEWSFDDVSLLLRFTLFLGAGAAAPVTGLAAMPIAALLATYGAALKLELGGRAIQEVAVRVAEGAANKVRDDVKTFTGKETCEHGRTTQHQPPNTLERRPPPPPPSPSPPPPPS